MENQKKAPVKFDQDRAVRVAMAAEQIAYWRHDDQIMAKHAERKLHFANGHASLVGVIAAAVAVVFVLFVAIGLARDAAKLYAHKKAEAVCQDREWFIRRALPAGAVVYEKFGRCWRSDNGTEVTEDSTR